MLLFTHQSADNADALRGLQGVSPLMRQLLAQRGIKTEAEANAFLRPALSGLHDPFLMQNMAAAVERINAAIAANEKVCVYGDYDCDGVTSSSILSSYLKSRGLTADVYIPSRHTEGYGLNMRALEELTREYSLIITVDCGISNAQEVAYVKGVGRDIIVTDHHQLPPELPDCLCLNPLMGDYPFPRLCGAGVALKLVQALGGLEAAKNYLDLAAIGTVADIVPLLDENRVIVSSGLAMMNQSMRPGVKALCLAAGLKADSDGNYKLRSGQIAFTLAPRINAGGRMETASRCVKLLTGTDEKELSQLAEYINAENTERQQQEREVIDSADAQLKDADFTSFRAIIICGEGWNPGVIGLAASRLKEKYNYPTLVFTRAGDNYVGSCRSIEGVDMFASLSSCRDLFLRFGGHPMAAGLTLPAANMPEFVRRFNEYLFAHADASLYFPRAEYDTELKPDQISIEGIRELELLQPCGCGNPEPVFRIQGSVSAPRVIGQSGNHLKFSLNMGGRMLDAVGWSMADRLPGLNGSRRDITCSLGINQYNGRETPQAVIREMAPLTPNDAINSLKPESGHRRALWLDSMLYYDYNGSYESTEITTAQLIKLLRRAPQGTLINLDSPEAMKRLMLAICGEGMTELPDISAGFPPDRRAFNALCLCGEGLPGPGYKYYVAAGGYISPGYMRELNAVGVRVLKLAGGDFGSALKLSDDALRSAYRAVAGGKLIIAGIRGIEALGESLAKLAGIAPDQAIVALHIFDQLGLVKLSRAEGSAEVLPMKKVNLADSSIYRTLCN